MTKAALRLHIAQPALSRQISDLNDEPGLHFFDRIGRRLLLSSEGEQLLDDCRSLLNHAHAIGEPQDQRFASHPLAPMDMLAACRLAGFEPNVLHEIRAPLALLALAEAGHGMAIIPSALRTHRYRLRIVGLTYRCKPLCGSLTMLSDKRRTQAPYAAAFCEMLAKYVREVFALTRPYEPRAESRARRSTARKAVRRLVHRPGL